MTIRIPTLLSPARLLIAWTAMLPGVSSAAWDAAPTLLDSSASTAGPVQVATEPFGNAVTVWTQGMDVLSRTWNGSAWTAETVIDNLGTAPEDASISLNASGNGMAIWRQPVAGILQVFIAPYNGGTNTWGTPVQLSSLATGNALDPRIAFGNNTGRATAVWRQSNGTETNLYASYWNGSSWTSPAVVDNLAGNVNAPSVVMDNSGNALAVWEQFDGSADSVFSSGWNGTSWSTPQQIDGIAGFIDTPHLAMSGTGQAIAVWQGFAGEFNIYAARLPSLLGAWGTPVVLDTLVGSGYAPRVAVNGSGNAVVVWEQTNGGGQDLYASRWNGSAWSAPSLIQGAAAAAVGIVKPQIGIDGSGNAIVVYNSGGDAMAARQLAAGNWGTPQALEAAVGSVDNPQVAVNSSGGAIAVWQQAQNVYAQRYTLDATYTITPAASPPAGGSAQCVPLSVTSGDSTVCTATANAGYTFTQWTTSSGNLCYVATCTFTGIVGNTTITAVFDATPTPVDGACGAADGNPVSSAPTTGLCSQGIPSAVAGTGPWTWTCAGSGGGSPASCSAPLLTAGPHAITVNTTTGGTASCSPNPVADGGSTVCTATPNNGYVWRNFTYGPYSSICGSNPCTIPNIVSAISVTAAFEPLAAPVDAAPVPALDDWARMLLPLLIAASLVVARWRSSRPTAIR